MKTTIISVVASIIIIGGAVMLVRGSSNTTNVAPADNVSIVNGQQIIEITAKGGFNPRKSIAKAGIPTTLRFITSGTFDCSSTVRIPSLGISRAFPQTGITDINIGSPQVATIQGACGMGMYPFEVDFQS